MSTAAKRRDERVRVSKLKRVEGEFTRTLLHSPKNDALARLHSDVWEKLRRNTIESRTGNADDN
jgi:hypothetical protein